MDTKQPDHVVVGLELKGDFATAFKSACGDAMDSYANFCRKVVVTALRDEGYLPPLDTPRRPRGRRRSEAA